MSTPEEAVHVHAQATVAVDLGTLFAGMTPQGFARAMELGNTTWKVTGYEITAQARDGDDYVFDVRYETDRGPMSLRYRFRDVDGEWKVVDVAHAT
jgi:ABC-type transporter MlaC component